MLLNYCCYCGAIWGISFESLALECFLCKKLASKFDASFLYKILGCVSSALDSQKNNDEEHVLNVNTDT